MKKILKNSGKIAVALSVIGVGSLVAVVLSGAAYPDMLFQILTPMGLLCTFAALALYIIQWISTIYKYYKKGEKSAASLLFVLGLLVLAFAFYRICLR